MGKFMSLGKFKSALMGGLALAAVGAAAPAGAVTIILHDIGGVTGSAAELGFNIAAKYWESVLTNNATLEINVGYEDLGPRVLGSTGSSFATYIPISDYYDVLNFTQTSALDAQAVANLSPLNSSGGVDVLVPEYLDPVNKLGIDVAGGKRTAPDDAINQTLALTTANLKAFGVDLGPGFIDAEIEFSNRFAFDFDPSNGITAGSYDFIGVAIHEIGHALGFVSGADDFDYSDGYPGPVDDAWWGYGLDMFRYGAPGQLDWTPGTDAYFSVDGGATAFMDGYFSTGPFSGDGNQASHWKQPDQATPCLNFRGVMNPYICGGKEDSVTGLDLALFDVIGWNLNVDVLAGRYDQTTSQIYESVTGHVPEPATWMTLILGLGLSGAALRRRRNALAA